MQVRTFVDTRLADLWTNQIVPRQATYFANNGKYWQGILVLDLASLPNNPSSGSPTVLEAAPVLTRKATDHPSWQTAAVNLGATIPMALQIDAYDGPQGRGYVAQCWVRWNGVTYTRAQNSGPEGWRTVAWQVAA